MIDNKLLLFGQKETFSHSSLHRIQWELFSTCSPLYISSWVLSSLLTLIVRRYHSPQHLGAKTTNSYIQGLVKLHFFQLCYNKLS